MATAMKKCKVCGNEYEYCHTNRRIAGVFRYQDVACSPEHAKIYFKKIEDSRASKDVEIINDKESSSICQEEYDFIDTYDDDRWFEDDFSDDDEEYAEETAITK